MNLEKLAVCDPEIAAAIGEELGRQRNKIELIASENFVSPAVMEAMGSVLTNKYAEGYPGHRYYGGCEYVFRCQCQYGSILCLFAAGRHHYGHEPVAGRASFPRFTG